MIRPGAIIKGGRNDLGRWVQFGGELQRPPPPKPTRPPQQKAAKP